MRVITDMYNTTHMGTTHTLYISNLDWEMYTHIVHYLKTIQTILQGYKYPAQKFSGETARYPLENLSKNLTKLHGTLPGR